MKWVLLLTAAVGSVIGQDAASATIRVAVTTEMGPVSGATVTINGTTVTTDANGVATTALPLGKVEIGIAKEGFFPAKTSLSVDAAREWQVNVELKLAEKVEEEVKVYATRTDTKIQDSPTRVEVIGRDEIEEETAMTPGNIVMLLNEMGGLRVQTSSASLGAASIRIQGMRGRYTAFLGDGLPLFGQEGGGLGLLQIPPVDLGQVEVIKGVASAMYGAGAMGGVVGEEGFEVLPGAGLSQHFLFKRAEAHFELFKVGVPRLRFGGDLLKTGDDVRVLASLQVGNVFGKVRLQIFEWEGRV